MQIKKTKRSQFLTFRNKEQSNALQVALHSLFGIIPFSGIYCENSRMANENDISLPSKSINGFVKSGTTNGTMKNTHSATISQLLIKW